MTQAAGGERPPVLVSACLLGVACDHRGGTRSSPEVAALASTYRLIPVCPESAGGLPTPRTRAEVQMDGSVRTADGGDVTDAYRRGAEQAVAIARASGITRAVLKARSPSCGCHLIYDGTFSDALVERPGITAAALSSAGVSVCSEEDLAPGGTVVDPSGKPPAGA